MTTNSTFRELQRRIKVADYDGLKPLEHRIERHYAAGTLTPKEFARLDVKVMEELARLGCL